jgi:ubiquinol-cytochrome c reductase cytochrome c1 subunit
MIRENRHFSNLSFFGYTAALALIYALCAMFGSLAFAAGGGHNPYVVEARINPQDKVSLQNGAKLFVNNCMGCHSLKYMRYERMADDLNIPHDIVEDQLMFNTDQIGDQMRIAMDPDSSAKWFGAPPPDLSLGARLRGNDWIYSFLISFYPDDSRPLGANNYVFEAVGMPNVLGEYREAIGDEAFKQEMLDLTNFLAYVADPIKLERERIGRYVLLFLAIFFIPVYFLNREYWKDVH